MLPPSKITRGRSRSRTRHRSRSRSRTYERRPSVDDELTRAVFGRPCQSTKFNVQLAHGSEMRQIGVFSNLRELYEMIDEQFNQIPSPQDILFCTINTHKIDMDHLLTLNIGLSDVIYVHLAGQTEEVKLDKTEHNLGLTISDNGAGRSFIKRIREGSIGAKAGLKPGDHIHKVNGEDTRGMRHFEVARVLRGIEERVIIILTIIRPIQSGFSFIAPRSTRPNKESTVNDGRMTLRLRAQGSAFEEVLPDSALLSAVNRVFESYLGVNDDQLAQLVVEMAQGVTTLPDLSHKISQSELAILQLPDEFVFDVWGALTDVRDGRVQGIQSIN